MLDRLKFCATHMPAAFYPILITFAIEAAWAEMGYYEDAVTALAFSIAAFVFMIIGSRTSYKHFKDGE